MAFNAPEAVIEQAVSRKSSCIELSSRSVPPPPGAAVTRSYASVRSFSPIFKPTLSYCTTIYMFSMEWQCTLIHGDGRRVRE
ncbi:hypothetical protein PsYK624_128500 [Phanerochaete sordida]|uniref:Uncharacterized protein n=1 Tax=Phanerochaete sordida TaxID=48140 RepID=A0A9P3GK37_9APHY|nr:hypothetical protein PsYK624_128500 [Phanerochaete sordida]